MTEMTDLPHDYPAWYLPERQADRLRWYPESRWQACETVAEVRRHPVIPLRARRTVSAKTVHREAGTCECGARWTGLLIAHCTKCHQSFGGIRGFDFHRIGHVDHRRCRTPEQLRGFGYEPNDRGIWRRPRPDSTLPDKS